MQISISQEDQVVLETIKDDLIRIKQTLLEWGLTFLIYTKNSLISFIASYEEYSISNIREKGLLSILTDRAIRFFKLECEKNGVEDNTKRYQKRSTQQKVKFIIKRVFKLILFPVYLLIICLMLLFKEKFKKNVINKYKT
ncbi:MAG: hypothetical protein WED10_11390 [Brumimicrobium sp.]